MAAPTVTALGTLDTTTQRKLEDGYRTAIAFSRLPTFALWEVEVTPPMVDGGDAIEQTTMRNSTYRTFTPRNLITIGEIQVSGAYDPVAYTQVISSLVNQEGTITVHFPDGSTLAAFAYLKSFEPDAHTEGEMPRANATIVVTNWDYASNPEVEAGPVLTNVTGT